MTDKKKMVIPEELRNMTLGELDDKQLEEVAGGASTNIYDCQNTSDCSGSSNWISCDNTRTCLANPSDSL